jgi:hypothetical protein
MASALVFRGTLSSRRSLPICLTSFKLGEQVKVDGPGATTLSKDAGDKEKSVASSSTTRAGEGGDGGSGTVRGSIMRLV